LTGGQIDDTATPAWEFDANAWTGAMLNTGGVAWRRLIPPGNSYGEHTNSLTFWNAAKNDAFTIDTQPVGAGRIAARFSNPGAGDFDYVQSVAPSALATKYYLRRFNNTLDLWAPFQIAPSTQNVDIVLKPIDYRAVYGRGQFKGIDGGSVTELMNTIGRYGVIDRHITGGNGWVSGYVCLHEPFFGEMGIAIDDADYTSNLAGALDDWRDHAIKPDGRVMARWCYDTRDNVVPGSFNPVTGYYDCGWGYLLDAQPDYVINTSETFDLNGSLPWLREHKQSCERALDWMLERDFDGSGLMSMMTGSHTQQKSSDWIDVVYACGKNALVNEEMYYALNLWADREELLGDRQDAERYRAAADKLRKVFVRPISDGGFWDPSNRCFDYWREADGTVHGDNLVEPVNFCAIAYGICNATQSKIVIDNIQSHMREEKLFHWPLCFTSYNPDDCRGMIPFPIYENGDIFLSWGETAVRAYSEYDPSIAIYYIRQVLDQYHRDGLSYQRYLRNTQTGAGNDILAGNSMTIVGLYRDIYGIRPQWDRLLLDPHITPDLAGTHIRYALRGDKYMVGLDTGSTSVAVNGFTVRSAGPFAVHSVMNRITCCQGADDRPSLAIDRPAPGQISITIFAWPAASRQSGAWTVINNTNRASIRQIMYGLKPGGTYQILKNGGSARDAVADTNGTINVESAAKPGEATSFTVVAIR
jgi:hypothetical protein